jgi:hypothetical protein
MDTVLSLTLLWMTLNVLTGFAMPWLSLGATLTYGLFVAPYWTPLNQDSGIGRPVQKGEVLLKV